MPNHDGGGGFFLWLIYKKWNLNPLDVGPETGSLPNRGEGQAPTWNGFVTQNKTHNLLQTCCPVFRDRSDREPGGSLSASAAIAVEGCSL